MLCDQHKISPVKIYSQCVGCELESLQQTIESQKEEIEKKDIALLAWMEREEKLKAGFDQLESKQIESLKAITELAVKENDALREGLTSIINMDNPIKSACIDRMHMIAKHTRTIADKIQIERLSQ